MSSSRQLPTISAHELGSHNSEKSCFVTLGTEVYDITSFLDAHPGGANLILQYAGKDVSEIMGNDSSHLHSMSAYELLYEHLIGFIGFAASDEIVKDVTDHDKPMDIFPMPSIEAVKNLLNTRETDPNADYDIHKFLDLRKPLLPQLWSGGFSKDFYLEQVHRPRRCIRSTPVFLFGKFPDTLPGLSGDLIPIVWLPIALRGFYLACTGLLSFTQAAAYWSFGAFLWTIVEYGLHRGLFHMDR